MKNISRRNFIKRSACAAAALATGMGVAPEPAAVSETLFSSGTRHGLWAEGAPDDSGRRLWLPDLLRRPAP